MNKYIEQSRQAQRERKKNRACTSKRAYSTEQAAFQKGQKIYRCHHCGLWHRSGSQARLIRKLRNIEYSI